MFNIEDQRSLSKGGSSAAQLEPVLKQPTLTYIPSQPAL